MLDEIQPSWTEEQKDAKIWEVIGELTQAQKLGLLSGGTTSSAGTTSTTIAVTGKTGTIPGITAKGIPAVSVQDGPAGYKNGLKATAWPSPTAIASTWNVTLMDKIGYQTGLEFAHYNTDVALGPAHDILRNPLSGRNFEYYSEDPVVSGKIAAAYTRGMQRAGVGVTHKHFAANEQESFGNGMAQYEFAGTSNSGNSGGGNVVASERALREIYFKSFEIPVREADPWGMMGSYASINGVQAHINKWLLTDLLRDEWGFKGMVLSDWGAVTEAARSTDTNVVYAAMAGMDLGMPSMNITSINTAINNGTYPAFTVGNVTWPAMNTATLDRNVFNVLKFITKTNTFNGKYGPKYQAGPTGATLHEAFFTSSLAKDSAAIAQEAAEEAIVLLKNSNNTLPLNRATDKVEIISSPHLRMLSDSWNSTATSTADFVIRGSGSSGVYVADAVMGTWNSENNPNRIYSFGQHLENEGLLAGTGTVASRVRDIYERAGRTKTVSYSGGAAGSSGTESRSYNALPAAWATNLTNDAAAVAAGGASVGVMLISRQASEGFDGTPEKITISSTYDTTVNTGNSSLATKSYYLSNIEEQAVKAYGEALHAAGKKFIVLLNTPSSLDTTIIDQYADAVLVVWYPGIKGAQAMTNVLFGDANPSGKLTQTFFSDFKYVPCIAAARALGVTRTSGTGNNAIYTKTPVGSILNSSSFSWTNAGWATNPVFYDEGVFVGYRWPDSKLNGTKATYDEQVAYPFGHGLSYTSFEFSNLSLSSNYFNLGNGDAEKITVTVDVKNTGTVKGKEVVQLYIGMNNYASEGRPKKDLRAFDKVELEPGQTKSVTLEIKLSDLQYYDDRRDPNQILTGFYTGYTHTHNPERWAQSSNVVYNLPGSGWKVTPGSVFNVIVGNTSNDWELAQKGVTASFTADYPEVDYDATTLSFTYGGETFPILDGVNNYDVNVPKSVSAVSFAKDNISVLYPDDVDIDVKLSGAVSEGNPCVATVTVSSKEYPQWLTNTYIINFGWLTISDVTISTDGVTWNAEASIRFNDGGSYNFVYAVYDETKGGILMHTTFFEPYELGKHKAGAAVASFDSVGARDKTTTKIFLWDGDFVPLKPAYVRGPEVEVEVWKRVANAAAVVNGGQYLILSDVAASLNRAMVNQSVTVSSRVSLGNVLLAVSGDYISTPNDQIPANAIWTASTGSSAALRRFTNSAPGGLVNGAAATPTFIGRTTATTSIPFSAVSGSTTSNSWTMGNTTSGGISMVIGTYFYISGASASGFQINGTNLTTPTAATLNSNGSFKFYEKVTEIRPVTP